MPKTNRIWTLTDVDSSSVGRGDDGGRGGRPPSSSAAAAAPPPNPVAAAMMNTSGSPQFLKCFHIPTLPQADEAKAMLDRVVREFEPIVQQRGYNVKSVSELCCCNDGLDFDGFSRRKIRKVADNIWGYNLTTFLAGRGRKSHTIHLRLRHADNHARFHLYEDVAGTMAHELAHCEVGPHNAAFYKLMEEILEQHATLMASKLTQRGGFSMPAFGGSGQALGGGNRVTNPVALAAARRKHLDKQQQQQQQQGQKLGGDVCFSQFMTPREAAVIAAEARQRVQALRKRGDSCCCPFVVDDDKENNNAKKPAALPLSSNHHGKHRDKRPKNEALGGLKDDENNRPAKRNATKRGDCIDLTASDDETETEKVFAAKPPPCALWSCNRCTFDNGPVVLACGMCNTERNWPASGV